MYIDTNMLIDWAKLELHIGKLKPDIRDLAKRNLDILKSRYVRKYDVIVPQIVVGEFCMVISEYYSDNLNPAMSWLSDFIRKHSLDIKPIPKYKAHSIIETAKEILSYEISSGDYGERQLDFTDSLVLSQALHDFDSKILLTTDGRMQEAVYIHEIEEKIDRPHNLKIIDDLSKVRFR